MVTTLSPAWYVYLVRAANQALYCGISLDAQKRFAQHCAGKGGAIFFHQSGAGLSVCRKVCG